MLEKTLLTGLAFGESPRWHQGRLWFCNWGAGEIIAVTPDGQHEVVVRLPFDAFPFSIVLWAALGEGSPDGICLDAQGAVWYADVPNKQCVRVREGGEVLRVIPFDRGCFACMLGGADRQTLFVTAAHWLGFENMMTAITNQTGQLVSVDVGG
jgi:sugar lactone lactonase YvrE